jgi:hypothetical protein
MPSRKKEDNRVFETVVVLAIVFMVAVTGLVLTSYENKNGFSADGITGNIVAEENTPAEAAPPGFLDLGISGIEINPPSPVIGTPFEIRITLNSGDTNHNSIAVFSHSDSYLSFLLAPASFFLESFRLFVPFDL